MGALSAHAKNAESKLLPGTYATATFQGKFAGQGVALPPNTLMFGKDGVRVAVVCPDSTVRLVDVAVAKDMGKVVGVSGLLSEKDTVISGPPDGLIEARLCRHATRRQGHH